MYKKNKLTDSIEQEFRLNYVKPIGRHWQKNKVRNNLIKSLGILDKKNNETNIYPHNLQAKIDK